MRAVQAEPTDQRTRNRARDEEHPQRCFAMPDDPINARRVAVVDREHDQGGKDDGADDETRISRDSAPLTRTTLRGRGFVFRFHHVGGRTRASSLRTE